ncbi:HAMP domain-containing histidine kinase [Draconibacterium sp.]|nr:HAMP domain-containing histidine kinase [Draconibacterium sp.]
MKYLKEITRKGIIFYYIIAIVIPCFLLGILAFRGIKNDQALVESEQRRILMETSKQIFQNLDKSLIKIETSFSDVAVQETLITKEMFNSTILSQFNRQHNDVEGIFFLDNQTKLSVCSNGLIYFPDGYIPESSTSFFPEVLKKGWQYEFSEKDFGKAFQFYYSLLKNSNNIQTRGDLLNAMARVQKKRGEFDSAVAIYDSIQQNYSRIIIQNKIPLGIMAFLEKNSCYLQLKDTVSALENSIMLLKMMVDKHWELEESYFFDYLEKTDKTITICRNSNNSSINLLLNKTEAIKDIILTAQQKTDYLLTFWNDRESIAESLQANNKTSSHRHKYTINGRRYFYSLLSDTGNKEWIVIFNTAEILENGLNPMLHEKASSGNFYWEISDEDGEKLSGSDNIPNELLPVKSDFPAGLPSWTLTLYPLNRGLLATFLRSGGGFFFYIFIAVLVILVFGLIFTLQTVNNKVELSKMKSSFVSTVSHELKSPLTSIRQIAEILVHKKVSSERKEKYFNMILQQSERLSHLIENILDFSKMEAGQKQFHFENTDLAVVAENVIQSFQDRLAANNFQIHLSISGSVQKISGDREAMEQVLYNLIDNAIKYSGKANKVDISLDSDDESVLISVRDYGIGIQKNEQEKIFQQFYRVGEELIQTVKGTGIGLTIVKQIVEAHKGKITVESSPGKGSTFILKFPVRYLKNET